MTKLTRDQLIALQASVKPDHPYAYKSVVFTGRLSMTRGEVEQLANALYMLPHPEVSRYTAFLVTGEHPRGRSRSRKLVAAERLGVPILTEAEFGALVTRLVTEHGTLCVS